MRLFLEQFEEHQEKGLACFRKKEFSQAKWHLLKAAEFLFKVAEKSEGELRQERIKKANKLLKLARNLKSQEASLTENNMNISPLEVSESSEEKNTTPITFDDVAGLDDVKEAIAMKLIYPIEHQEKAARYGISSGGGILLFGPPGTGKTLIAKATAGELKRKFFAIYPSEILSKYVGEAEKNCAEVFRKCREEPNSILFIDEVEALLPHRGSENQSPVMQRLVPQILSELDGVKTNLGSMLLLAATNEPWTLDPAVLRPGRFDDKIYVGLPDFAARLALLKIHLKLCPLGNEVDLAAIAHQLRRYSGADVRLVCQKTAQKVFLESLKCDSERPLTQQDFVEVIQATPPSITTEQLARFQNYLEQMGMLTSSRRKNGEV